METIRAADGGYLLNSEQFNYTKDAQGRPVLNVVGGGGGTVTEADIEKALGYKPIGAADVPVKKVNGATGEVKGTFYVTVTQGADDSVTADKTLEEIYTAHESGYAVYAKTATVPQVIVPLTVAMHSGNNYLVVFSGATNLGETIEYTIANEGSGWETIAQYIAFKDDIPTIPSSLKNPHPLNIKIGNKTTTYDGSAAKTVEIPKGVPDVTATDNGKILRVVNGAWAAAELLSAGGASF